MSRFEPPPAGGISDALVDTDDLLPPKWQWERAARNGTIVGQCRRCAADMRAVSDPDSDTAGEGGQIVWYEAVCANGHTVVSPNGRVLRKSGIHGEMPGGWWDRREKRDQAQLRGEGG